MADTNATVQIDKLDEETIKVPIIGTSPLIIHRFSEKAKKQMLDAMQGNRSPKVPKDPQAEYEAAAYRFEDGGYGFPVIGFKQAAVSAARFYGKDVSMTALRQFVFFRGDLGVDGQMLARIVGTPHIREDVARVARGGTDLRYRPEWTEWSTTLEITFIRSAITRNSVVSLVDAGGLGVGIGEWRPERNGDFGTFRVDSSKKIEVIE